LSAAILCFFAFFNISCENPFIEKAFYLTTITFNTNGGSDVPQQKLLMGEAIARPADPVKGSSVFLGWYTDNKTFDHEWDFTIAPEKNMILYARWDEVPNEELPNEELTLILDTSELENNGDSVSFSASGAVLETSASGGDIITVFYMLADSHDNNWFSLSINGERVFETYETGTGSYNYTVNYNDANNGVITIHANSLHSDLNLLLSPDNVHFDKTGKITFDAHVTNPTGTTFSFTLFKDNIELDDFANMSITSGMIPANIVNKMLESTGEYHVKMWAQTDRQDYMPSSDFTTSSSVHVYNVSVTINGAADGETVSVSGRDGSHSTSFNFIAFGGDTVTLTASPGTERMVIWSGGSGIGNTCTVANITGEVNVIAAFAAAAVTVTVNDVTTGYADLASAFTAIGTTAGNYAVTLLQDLPISAGITIGTAGQNITIVGKGERTITHEITNNTSTHMFTINNATASLTLGNNITIKGRTTTGYGVVINNTNGTFKMLDGSKITGHTINLTLGAAVEITAAGSHFIMEGGSIDGNNNTAGGTSSTASGGVCFTSGTFTMTGGSITGNKQGNEDSDIYHAVNAANSFNISGNAVIGALKLNALSVGAGATVKTTGWTGSITTLNLRGNIDAIASAASYWAGNPRFIFDGIDAAQVNNIGLGEFISFNNARQGIAPTCFIGTSGGDLGRLIINPATAPVTVTVDGVSTDYLNLARAFTAIGTNAGDYTITLRENQTMTESRSVSAGQNITIVGAGDERTITHAITNAATSMFAIESSTASLTLGDNITIKGRSAPGTGFVIYINNSGKFSMQPGSKITGHTINAATGAAVQIGSGSNSGTFTMNGGSITGNNNTNEATTASGGVAFLLGVFTMNGGSITGNTHGGTEASDVYHGAASSNNLTISGDAVIGALKLYASSTTSATIVSIGAGWTGSITRLNLRGTNTDLATAMGFWTGSTRTIFNNITAAQVERIGLGEFISSDNKRQAISNTHRIGTDVADLGKLVTYKVGDTGPAGGIIFYHDPNGFTVQGYTGTTGSFAEYTAYYLEAAPANESNSEWGAYGTLIPDVTTFTNIGLYNTLTIGVGRRDTQIIVNHLGTNETGKAAQVCASKTVTVGGTVFNDWFLPSLGELNEMYKANGQTGIPTTGYFWSSSQSSSNLAWIQYFTNGLQSTNSKDSFSSVLRAIRAF